MRRISSEIRGSFGRFILISLRKSADSAQNMIVTAKDFQRIALSLPEAIEGQHFGHADFRMDGKIFATLGLAKEGFGVLLLTPEQQAGMIEDDPKIFSPVPGGWGQKGSTRVLLAKVPRDILEAALRTAWRRKAPKRLLTTKPS
jgi:hypothetical protein